MRDEDILEQCRERELNDYLDGLDQEDLDVIANAMFDRADEQCDMEREEYGQEEA